jgi:hypothetical protein
MRALFAIGTVLLGFATPTVGQPMQLTGTFSSTKLYAKPGQTMSSGFQLTLDPNYHPTIFHSSVSDFYRSEDGKQSFYPPSGTLPHSCGQWVSLNPVEKLINPGEKLDVRLTVSVPVGTQPGGYWCVLNVDQLADPVEEKSNENGETQVHLKFLASISTGIFVYIQPLNRSAQVAAVDISADTARVKLINDGNTPLTVEGRFEFTRETVKGEPVKVPLARTTIFTEPENSSILTVPLPPEEELPSGAYIVRLILDVGLDHLIGVQRKFELQRAK